MSCSIVYAKLKCFLISRLLFVSVYCGLNGRSDIMWFINQTSEGSRIIWFIKPYILSGKGF
ncbi:hypothetical protein HanHA300_Chr10g0360741 [Helianthus annuus]|nr:hypothetical protein HanHA300_Chr10g0360741 [Helianthus annuus]KAJ0529800.1 hypothetical protein HanHA89_Chr10g0382171 [Helianthus annuus]KAJ0696675.1 hypothetical protein HanLR1_Chr10g0359931 [Helianthus annuus]